MFPYSAEVILILCHWVRFFQFRDDIVHGSYLAKEFHCHYRVLAGEHLAELIFYSLFSDNFQSADIANHTLVCIILNLPTITTCEPYTSQDAKRVIVVYCIRIVRCSYDVVLNVIDSFTGNVHNLTSWDICIECIDCKVSTHTVILDATESCLRITARVVEVLFFACLNELQFNLRELIQMEHGHTIVRINSNAFGCITIITQPFRKTNTTALEWHAHINVLYLQAHDFVSYTSTNSEYVTFPFSTDNESSKKVFYLYISSFFHRILMFYV